MNLKSIRNRIDIIDFSLIKLLRERMRLAVQARRFKSAIIDPEREQHIRDRMAKHSTGLILPEFSQNLFDVVFSESRRLQTLGLSLVGFQGEHGAFGEFAALRFAKDSVPIPCLEFGDVFKNVSDGHLDLGIVPIENSLEGSVAQVNDLFVETDLKIVGEIWIPINHSLLTLPETNYREIKVVYSHPQALSQCRGFILRNHLEVRPFYDTAGAAEMLSRDRPKATGVIANALCADLYNLSVIKKSIEDHPSNATRFVVVSKNKAKGKGDKCSIMFSTLHKSGTLFRVLEVFSKANINLTRIESRPIRNTPGKYAFFCDFQGADHEGRVSKTLETLDTLTESIRLLGCYKSAKL